MGPASTVGSHLRYGRGWVQKGVILNGSCFEVSVLHDSRVWVKIQVWVRMHEGLWCDVGMQG